MPEPNAIAHENISVVPWWIDIFAGGAIGILLGLLIGLSGSPIVSTVAAGLLTLLAGLFGFSANLPGALSVASARRLIAFCLAATILIPAAVSVRTHDLLGPSIRSQKAMLVEIGIRDDREQTEMLRFLRFGILPPQSTSPPKDSTAAIAASQRASGLFSQPASFCSSLLLVRNSPKDMLALFDQQSSDLKDIANSIRTLSDERRLQVLSAAPTFLCGVR
jgi:hypothetical protein